jgi:hypothetical protein
VHPAAVAADAPGAASRVTAAAVVVERARPSFVLWARRLRTVRR